jgi:hypothetical protein
MNPGWTILKALAAIGAIATLVMGMNACAGLPEIGGATWKEEVLLHDGRKIVVTRTVERGGRHEIGQRPPYREQQLSFTLPDTGSSLAWEDHFSKDLGAANFLPMLLDVYDGVPYLVVYPNEKGSVSFGIFEQVISMKTRQGKNQMTLAPFFSFFYPFFAGNKY